MQQKEAEKLVRSWGFSHVFTWSDEPNAHYPPHSHGTLTTHLVLRGELVISYPKDEEGPHPNDIGAVAIHEGDGEGTKWKYGVGGRIDVDEEREHEVWLGPEGCTYVIGEK